MNPTKPFWQSKTLWLNALTATIAVVMSLAGQGFIHDNPLLASAFVFVIAVLNSLLRFVTDLPISSDGKPKATMFKLCAMFVLGVGFFSSASQVTCADDVAVVVDSSQPKSYLLTIDSLGGVSLSPLKAVVRPGPSPLPNPPVPPAPTVLTDRAKAIRDLAVKVTGDPDRTGTAHGLAEMYRQIATIVRQGSAPDVPTLVNAVNMATNSFLASRGTPPGSVSQLWQPTRDQFGVQWTLLTAKSAPLSDYAVLLDEVASGLDASAADDKAITPQMLAFIMQIIQLILSLLKPVP